MEEQAAKALPIIEDDFKSSGPIPEQRATSREVSFILDHSAFTLGLGNIKRWFDKEYFRSRVSDKDERVHLSIYIPMNTLHELMLKKSLPTIASTRAKEALAFIDEMMEKETQSQANDLGLDSLQIGSEAENHSPSENVPSESNDGPRAQEASKDAPQGKEKAKKLKKSRSKKFKSKKDAHKGEFSYALILEDRAHGFLSWRTCLKYQLRTPLKREFPAYKNLVNASKHGGHAVQGVEELDDEASIPSPVTYLIRSCVSIRGNGVSKKHAASKDQWVLVTEDAVSKIWADSFGMDSLNINEAELLLFQGKDLGSFEVKAPGADFFSETDVYDSVSSPLHNVVNTTSYNYSNLKEENVKVDSKGKNGRAGKKPNAKKSKAKAKAKAMSKEQDTESPKKENGVMLEEFDMINYAPRTSSSGLISSSLISGSKKSKQGNGNGKRS